MRPRRNRKAQYLDELFRENAIVVLITASENVKYFSDQRPAPVRVCRSDVHATRYLSSVASLIVTPSPGPAGIDTYPSSLIAKISCAAVCHDIRHFFVRVLAWGQRTEAAPKLFDILVLIAPLQEILGRRGLVLATDAGKTRTSNTR